MIVVMCHHMLWSIVVGLPSFVEADQALKMSPGQDAHLNPSERQETRMLSQALNRAMLHSRNQLEGVNRKKLIFYLAVQLYCTLYCTSSKPASALLFN